MPPAERPFPEVLAALADLAQQVIDQVLAGAARQAIERTVLRGLQESSEARDQLGQVLEMGRVPKNEAEAVADALAQVEQKVAFFQGCTTRRSSLFHAGDDEALACAIESEQLAEQVRQAPALDRLIEAYKRTEALEAQIATLRESNKSGTGPEPRVLDLPRARVLVARRAIGAAVVALDDDEV